MNKEDQFVILSPDGFPIYEDRTYATPENAWRAFERWKKRYEHQGYYSSNFERIPLDELKDRCTLTTI